MDLAREMEKVNPYLRIKVFNKRLVMKDSEGFYASIRVGDDVEIPEVDPSVLEDCESEETDEEPEEDQ